MKSIGVRNGYDDDGQHVKACEPLSSERGVSLIEEMARDR